MSDTYDHRLKLAEKLGADITINPAKEDFLKEIKRLTEGKMCGIVFEAVGFSETAKSAVNALRTAGTAVWVGNAQKMVQINMQKVVTTENKIIGTHIYTLEEFEAGIRLLTEKKADVLPLITDRFQLASGADAFNVLQNNTEGTHLKVMINI